jgi:hypothetical protein
MGPDGSVDDGDIPTLQPRLPLVPCEVSWVNCGAPYRPGGRYGQRTPLTETMPELEA